MANSIKSYIIKTLPWLILLLIGIAMFIASKYQTSIDAGGDTDTNASLAGQLAGALLGIYSFPEDLILKLQTVDRYKWMMEIIYKAQNCIS